MQMMHAQMGSFVCYGIGEISFGSWVPNLVTLLMLACYQGPSAAGVVAGFSGSGIKITCEGCPYLGAAIGSECYVNSFVADKVKGWTEEVMDLSQFVVSQPHAAYCAFTHGLSSRWLFVSHTVPSDSAAFQLAIIMYVICNLFCSLKDKII